MTQQTQELPKCSYCNSSSGYVRRSDSVWVCNRCGSLTPITLPAVEPSKEPK